MSSDGLRCLPIWSRAGVHGKRIHTKGWRRELKYGLAETGVDRATQVCNKRTHRVASSHHPHEQDFSRLDPPHFDLRASHTRFMLMMLASPAVEVQDDWLASDPRCPIAGGSLSEEHQLKSQLNHPLNWMNEISVYPPVRMRPTTDTQVIATGPAVFDVCGDGMSFGTDWGSAASLNEAALMGVASAGYRAPAVAIGPSLPGDVFLAVRARRAPVPRQFRPGRYTTGCEPRLRPPTASTAQYRENAPVWARSGEHSARSDETALFPSNPRRIPCIPRPTLPQVSGRRRTPTHSTCTGWTRRTGHHAYPSRFNSSFPAARGGAGVARAHSVDPVAELSPRSAVRNGSRHPAE